MRLGNSSVFAIDIEPVSPSWERISSYDRGPWARFSIWVRGKNLTANVLPGTAIVRDGVFVPLTPIADWLIRSSRYIAFEESAHTFSTGVDLPDALARWAGTPPASNVDEATWDDERFAWSERHFLLAGGDGSWLPNVAFVKSDDDLWVSWSPAIFSSDGTPRFLEHQGVASVPWSAGRDVFESFVGTVAAAYRETCQDRSLPWLNQDRPLRRALELSWSEMASIFIPLPLARVYDIFSVGDEVALNQRLGLAADTLPVDSVALRALRDLNACNSVADPLVECETESRTARSGALGSVRQIARDAARDHSPEAQGYEAATAIRAAIECDAQPLSGLGQLLEERFDVVVRDAGARSANDHCIAGAHLTGQGRIVLLQSPRTDKAWSRNMEILRGLGHLLLDGASSSGVVGAGSSTRAGGPRRRRSGTFAAEMLLPRGAMKSIAGTLDAATEPAVFTRLMEEFGVGARTAAWQLWNAGLLSSREAVDDLIETHGARGPD